MKPVLNDHVIVAFIGRWSLDPGQINCTRAIGTSLSGPCREVASGYKWSLRQVELLHVHDIRMSVFNNTIHKLRYLLYTRTVSKKEIENLSLAGYHYLPH